MGQRQIARRRATRRRTEAGQPEPLPQQPARAGATDEACASILARIDEVTAQT